MTKLSRIGIAVLTTVVARGASAQDITCDPRSPAHNVEVSGVTFSGNSTFPDDQLAAGILTTATSWTQRHLHLFGKRYCLDSLAVRQDSLRLAVFYLAHGFPDVRVAYSITPVRKRAVDVHFQIREGEPTLVSTLTFTGMDSVAGRERLLRGLPLAQGSRFDQLVVEETRDSLVRRLRDNGYPLADVLRSYGPDSTRSHRDYVEYDVSPGPLSYLRNIDVTVQALADTALHQKAITHLEPHRVKDVLGIREGQLYRETSLEQVKRGLYLTEAFRHVDVSIDSTSLPTADEDSITVDVRVVESDLHAGRVQAGWGNLDCVRAQGAYTNYAFMGRLRRLDLTGRVSKVGVGAPLNFGPGFCTSQVRHDILSDTLNYYVAATLSQAALFRLPFIPSLTVFSERRSEFEAFLRDTPLGIAASLQQGSGSDFPKTFSYDLEYGSTIAQPAFFCALFNVCEDAARERLERRERSAVLGWNGSIIHANNNVDPTHGSVLRIEVRHSSPLVGSAPDLGFNRGTIDGSYYAALMGGTLALRIRAGTVLGSLLSFSGNPAFIPIQERLYAGGPNTVRGFRQNELGPAIYIPTGRNTFDTVSTAGTVLHHALPGDSVFLRAVPERSGSPTVVPTGGNDLVVGNVEYRIHSFFLPDVVEFAFFVDAGQVWTRGVSAPGTNLRELRVTPGLGVRVFSPIGPVRVDVGYNPYAPPSGPAYYNPLIEGGYANTANLKLICVSPGNQLRVRLGDPTANPRTPPEQIDSGPCPATFVPSTKRTFLGRLTLSFSLGQAF